MFAVLDGIKPQLIAGNCFQNFEYNIKFIVSAVISIFSEKWAINSRL